MGTCLVYRLGTDAWPNISGENCFCIASNGAQNNELTVT